MADRETDDGGSYPGMYGEETEAKLIRYISAAAQLMAAKFLKASALSCRYSLQSGGPAEVSRTSRMQLQSKYCGEEGEICGLQGHPGHFLSSVELHPDLGGRLSWLEWLPWGAP